MSSTVTSWKRLEPRHRLVNVRAGLERRIADPAWMLARQWQIGEFEASDGGTPLLFEVDTTTAMISRFRAGLHTGGIQTGTSFNPAQHVLDPWVEHEADDRGEPARSPLFDVFIAERLFDELMLALGSPLEAIRDAWRAHWIDIGGFGLSSTLEASSDEAQSALSRGLTGGRLLNGHVLYGYIAEVFEQNKDLPEDSPLVHVPADYDAVNATVKWWSGWVYGLRPITTTPIGQSWNQARLAYEFAIGARLSTAASDEVVLDGVSQGQAIDWYSFDRKAPGAGIGASPNASVSTTRRLLSPMRPPGVNAARFWTMDEDALSYAQVEASTMELGRALWLEFLLSFSESWWLVPMSTPLGSLVRLSAPKMMTTFDESIALPILGQSPGTFRLFALHDESQMQEEQALLLLPPTAASRQSSPPRETVQLMRDEMQNIAWAIEQTVPDVLGFGRERHDAWKQQTARPFKAGVKGDVLAYELSREVPDFWYPLVPQATRDNDGLINDITLQQGRLLTRLGAEHPPQGVVLSQGLSLSDELVPRLGRKLVRQERTTRWTQGALPLWHAKSRQSSDFSADSGLEFDQLTYQTDRPQEPAVEGAQTLLKRYPWTIYDTFDTLSGNHSVAAVGGSGKFEGSMLRLPTTAFVRGSGGALKLRAPSSNYVRYPDVQLDYIQRFGIFTIVTVVTYDATSPGFEGWLLGTTASAQTPGVALRYVGQRLRLSVSDGELWHEVDCVEDVFASQGPVPLVLTSDGQTLVLYAFDREVATLSAQATWWSTAASGTFCVGSANELTSPTWQGALGMVAVMPRALSGAQVSALVQEMSLSPLWPSGELVCCDGGDPLTHWADGVDQIALSNQEIERVSTRGRAGLSFARNKGAQAQGMLRRASAGGLQLTPAPGAFEHGLNAELTAALTQSTWLVAYRPNTQARATLIGAKPEAVDDTRLGFELEVDGLTKQLVIWERGSATQLPLGDIPLEERLGLVAITLDESQWMSVWTDASPWPVLTQARPSAYGRFEGTWSSTLGELRLRQIDDSVWGDCGTEGRIEGRINPETGRFEGVFNGAKVLNDIELSLSAMDVLEGLWGEKGSTLDQLVTASLTASQQPTLTAWPTGTTALEGTWETSLGTLSMRHAGTRVWGELNGYRLEGSCDLESGEFVAVHETPDGNAVMTVSYNNNTLSGSYAMAGQPAEAFDAGRVSSTRPKLKAWSEPALSLDVAQLLLATAKRTESAFEGDIYELWLWDRALSSPEVFAALSHLHERWRHTVTPS